MIKDSVDLRFVADAYSFDKRVTALAASDDGLQPRPLAARSPNSAGSALPLPGRSRRLRRHARRDDDPDGSLRQGARARTVRAHRRAGRHPRSLTAATERSAPRNCSEMLIEGEQAPLARLRRTDGFALRAGRSVRYAGPARRHRPRDRRQPSVAVPYGAAADKLRRLRAHVAGKRADAARDHASLLVDRDAAGRFAAATIKTVDGSARLRRHLRRRARRPRDAVLGEADAALPLLERTCSIAGLGAIWPQRRSASCRVMQRTTLAYHQSSANSSACPSAPSKCVAAPRGRHAHSALELARSIEILRHDGPRPSESRCDADAETGALGHQGADRAFGSLRGSVRRFNSTAASA
jgi:hypothetical protein